MDASRSKQSTNKGDASKLGAGTRGTAYELRTAALDASQRTFSAELCISGACNQRHGWSSHACTAQGLAFVSPPTSPRTFEAVACAYATGSSAGQQHVSPPLAALLHSSAAQELASRGLKPSVSLPPEHKDCDTCSAARSQPVSPRACTMNSMPPVITEGAGASSKVLSPPALHIAHILGHADLDHKCSPLSTGELLFMQTHL